MQKWEYLQIHVESSKGRLLVSVNGHGVADKKEFSDMAGLMGYLNSLGAEGWEMVNAHRNEYGFQTSYQGITKSRFPGERFLGVASLHGYPNFGSRILAHLSLDCNEGGFFETLFCECKLAGNFIRMY